MPKDFWSRYELSGTGDEPTVPVKAYPWFRTCESRPANVCGAHRQPELASSPGRCSRCQPRSELSPHLHRPCGAGLSSTSTFDFLTADTPSHPGSTTAHYTLHRAATRALRQPDQGRSRTNRRGWRFRWLHHDPVPVPPLSI